MNNSTRIVAGTPLVFTQGITEEIQYVFHLERMLTGIGAPSTPITCHLYDISDGTDMASTLLEGSSALDGYDFTTPIVKGLARDKVYRLVPEFTVGTQTFTTFKDLIGEL